MMKTGLFRESRENEWQEKCVYQFTSIHYASVKRLTYEKLKMPIYILIIKSHQLSMPMFLLNQLAPQDLEEALLKIQTE
uniref:Uncharacterized protein n=1 Tax=Trichuris muris TaxID=70415 RepID=A0A5S6QJ17_TRIMR